MLQNAATGTKTNTPVMDTPFNVQVVSQQVLQDQQATTLRHGVAKCQRGFRHGRRFNLGWQWKQRHPFARVSDKNLLPRRVSRGQPLTAELTTSPPDSWPMLQSVEVLKGPGAILYGIVDPGGVINLATKEPLDAPYYAVRAAVRLRSRDYRTTVDATGPLNTDKSLLYRMNMSYENNGAPFGSFIDLTHAQSLFRCAGRQMERRRGDLGEARGGV